MRISKLPTLFLALLACSTAAAQAFDYDDIADGRFRPAQLAGIRPTADGEHYTTIRDGNIFRHRYAVDDAGTALLPAAAEEGAVALDSLDRATGTWCDAGSRRLDIADYAIAPDGGVLVTDGAEPIYRHSFTMLPLLRRPAPARDSARHPLPARRRLHARRPQHRLFEPQQPVCLQYRTAGHAADHPRRPLERDDQRHDRLGLRGGVRLHARLRRLARLAAHRLPAFRRVARAALRDDALRRRALQPRLRLQIPQGGRRQFGGDAPRLRPRNGPHDEGRHRRRHHAIHSPHRLDAARGVVVRDPRPPSAADRLPPTGGRRAHGAAGGAADDLPRAFAPLCGPRNRPFVPLDRRRTPLPHYAGDGDGLDAPLPRRARRTAAGAHRRALGGDRHRRSRRPRGLLHLDRAVAARTQPLRRRLQGTAQTPAHARQGVPYDRSERRNALLHLDLLVGRRSGAGGDLRRPGTHRAHRGRQRRPAPSGRQHPSAAQSSSPSRPNGRHAGRLHRPPRGLDPHAATPAC